MADAPTMYLNIVRSEGSLPFEYIYTLEALNEALTHYTDSIDRLDWTSTASLAYDMHGFER